MQFAIKKIQEEMEKNNNPYIQAIGTFLLQHLKTNPVAADKIMTAEKTILKSLDEMKKVAEKKKVGNCAVLTDQEGFEIVLKYFGIDGAVEIPPIGDIKSEPVITPVVAAAAPEKNELDFDIGYDDLF